MDDADRSLFDTLLSAHMGVTRYDEVIRQMSHAHPDVVFMLQVETWAPRRVSGATVTLVDPDSLSAYAQVAHLNPFLSRMPNEREVFVTERFVSRAEVKRTEFYDTFGRDFWDVTSAFALPIRSDPDGLVAITATMPDDFAESDRTRLYDRLERLLRPVQHSFWLAGQMAEKARAEGAAMSMDAMGLPAALIGPSGRVEVTNAAWRTAAGRLTVSRDGRLSASDAQTARRVEEAVRFALSRRATARVGVPLGHGPPAILSLVPLGASQPAVLQEAVTPRPLLLATIVDPFRHRGSPRALLQDLYGLTPAECALAVLLRDGHSLRQAAGIRSVAYPTARNQLASVLGKLQLHSQSELRAFLARLSLVEPEGEGAP